MSVGPFLQGNENLTSATSSQSQRGWTGLSPKSSLRSNEVQELDESNLMKWGTIQKTQERRQKPKPEWRVWSGDQAAWSVWLSWQNWEGFSETVCRGQGVDKMKPSRGFQAKLGQAAIEDEELNKWRADFCLGGVCISNWPAVSTTPDSVYFSKSMPSVLLKVRQCYVCSLNTNY